VKKNLLAAMLVTGFGALALAPQAARAVDGTINITGTITANTCAINGASPSSTTVVLPTVQTSALTGGAAKVAGSTPFSLAATGCPVATGHTLTAYFEPGINIDTATHNLVSTGTAAGVQVQLLNGSGSTATAFSPILLGNAASTQNSGAFTVSATGTATLNYYAQYYASLATVSAGTVVSAATFTLIYN
jgi:major type 1 subunit fimbrin (pilin)